MLNELAEYEQYTSPNVKSENPRFKFDTLIGNKFVGLERALTIIARYHIFGDNDKPVNFNDEKIKNFLNAWCGFKFDKKFDVPQNLINHLPKYIINNFLNPRIEFCRNEIGSNAELNEVLDEFSCKKLLEDLQTELYREEISYNTEVSNKEIYNKKLIDDLKNAKNKLKNFYERNSKLSLSSKCNEKLGQINKTADALIDLFDKKAKYFGKGILSHSDTSKGKTNLYEINFVRVIANALLLGKIKNYVLVCNCDPFYDFNIKNFTDSKPLGKNLGEKNEDLILKLTAICLLNANYSDQKFTPINASLVSTWLLWEKAKDFASFNLQQFKFDESQEPLFEIRKNPLNKIKINPKWLENFWLAEESELDNPENQGRIFFRDSGYAVSLEKHTR